MGWDKENQLKYPDGWFKTKEKLCAVGFKQNTVPWNKGQRLSEEHKKNVSIATKKAMANIEIKKRIIDIAKNRKFSIETRKKMQNAMFKRITNGGHPNYKGGITLIHEKIRKSFEYKLWRKAVFERDGFACVWCGNSKSGILNADHIKPFAHYPELRFAIDNGRTLCVDCHRKTDTYGRKKELLAK